MPYPDDYTYYGVRWPLETISSTVPKTTSVFANLPGFFGYATNYLSAPGGVPSQLTTDSFDGHLGFYFDNLNNGTCATDMVVNQSQLPDYSYANSTGLSWSFWLKMLDSNAGNYMAIMTDGESACRVMVLPASPALFSYGGYNHFSTANLPAAGVTFQLVITLSASGDLTFYVDGTQLGSTVSGVNMSYGYWDVDCIGADFHNLYGVNHYRGWLGAVRFILAELTISDILGEWLEVPCSDEGDGYAHQYLPLDDLESEQTTDYVWQDQEIVPSAVEGCPVDAIGCVLVVDGGPSRSEGCSAPALSAFFFDNPLTETDPSAYIHENLLGGTSEYTPAGATWTAWVKWHTDVTDFTAVWFMYGTGYGCTVWAKPNGEMGINAFDPSSGGESYSHYSTVDVPVGTGTWVHFAWVADLSGYTDGYGDVTFYVNGEQLGATLTNIWVPHLELTGYWGGSKPQFSIDRHRNFKGWLSSLRHVAYALSADEISGIYEFDLCPSFTLPAVDCVSPYRYDSNPLTLFVTIDPADYEIPAEYNTEQVSVQICKSTELKYQQGMEYDAAGDLIVDHHPAISDYQIPMEYQTGPLSIVIPDLNWAMKYDIGELIVHHMSTAFIGDMDELAGAVSGRFGFVADLEEEAPDLSGTFSNPISFSGNLIEEKDSLEGKLAFAGELLGELDLLVGTFSITYSFDGALVEYADALTGTISVEPVLSGVLLETADTIHGVIDATVDWSGTLAEVVDTLTGTFFSEPVFTAILDEEQDLLAGMMSDDNIFTGDLEEELDGLIGRLVAYQRFAGVILQHHRWR